MLTFIGQLIIITVLSCVTINHYYIDYKQWFCISVASTSTPARSTMFPLCPASVLTVVEYLVVSLPVPLVLLLLVGHAAGQEHLVSVVTLSAGRVLLKFNY